jgi:predicted nucleic acid-binding protein
VRFWDASAIAPLLIAEASTRRLRALAASDPDLLVWWGSGVEFVSALARLESAPPHSIREPPRSSSTDSTNWASGWHEVDPSDIVRETATRLLRVHPLRAADALQLAAAFIAAEQRPASLEMVTLDDDRLADAARKEGFAVIDIPTA